MTGGIGMAGQRGFWLRCFLAAAGPLFLAVGASGQVDCFVPPPIHVSRVQGTVFDYAGVPIPNVTVSLIDDQQTVSTAKTGVAGDFSIPAPPKRYKLRMSAAGFADAVLFLDSGRDLTTLLNPGRLRIILGMPFLNCTMGTTNKKQFLREVQNAATRLKGTAQKNAAQK